jgi:type IV secretion system protein VirB4
MIIIKDSKSNKTRLQVPVPEFIPYACHYDSSTLLTKNGQLLQTIKIVGFSHETIDSNLVDLREIIRNSILGNIKNDNFAIWFHTVRRKKSLDPEGTYERPFMYATHEAWCKKNYWRDKYVNELYITIIIDGDNFKITNPKSFFESFSFKSQKKQHETAIFENYNRLNQTVNNCLESLKEFGAKRLEITVDEAGAVSEPLQFFDKIIHMTERRTPVPVIDLSKYLATHKIAFGNNAFEVRNGEGKYFGAILSIKEYHEQPLENLDKFLHLAQQFVITHTVEFISANKALEKYKYQDYILNLSGDLEFRKLCGIEDMFNNNQLNPTDYCHQQITITLIDEDLKKLDNDVKRAAKELSKLGLVTIREDLNLESCFWAQLPANFPFIKRKTEICSKIMGGFLSLHNYPVGSLNSRWGSAVTLFRTASGTPYFFNFHVNNIGHSFIAGPIGSGKTTLVNFLLSESFKFSPRITMLDYKQHSKIAVKAMEGSYSIIDTAGDTLAVKYNPLLLEDTPENRNFIKEWLLQLIYGFEFNNLNQEKHDAMIEIVKRIYSLPINQRKLNIIIEWFNTEKDQEIYEKMGIWCNAGQYAKLFNNEQDEFNDNVISAIDITEIFSDKENLMLPVISYILHRYNLTLDGNPNIIVLNDCLEMFNNPYFHDYLKKWLGFLTDNNAIAIFTAEIISKEIINPELAEIIINNCFTKIYLPSDEPEIYKKYFKLKDSEYKIAKTMRISNRNFLLIQGDEAIVAELNLDGLDSIRAILSGEKQAEKLINDIINETKSENPNEWLEIYFSRYN